MFEPNSCSWVYENVSLHDEHQNLTGYLVLEEERMAFYAGSYGNENENNSMTAPIQGIGFGSITKCRMSKRDSDSQHLKLYLLSVDNGSSEAVKEEETVVCFNMASKDDLEQIHTQVKSRRKRSSLIIGVDGDIIPLEVEVGEDEIMNSSQESISQQSPKRTKQRLSLVETSPDNPFAALIVLEESLRSIDYENDSSSQHQQVDRNHSFSRAEPPSLLATTRTATTTNREEQNRMAKQRASRAPMTTTRRMSHTAINGHTDHMMMHASWPNNRSNIARTQSQEDRDNYAKERARSRISPFAMAAASRPGASFVRDPIASEPPFAVTHTPDHDNPMMHASWPHRSNKEAHDNHIKQRASSKMNPSAREASRPGASFVRDYAPLSPLSGDFSVTSEPSASSVTSESQSTNNSSRAQQQEQNDCLIKRRARSRPPAAVAAPGASFVRNSPSPPATMQSTSAPAPGPQPSSRDAMDRKIKQRARGSGRKTAAMRPGSSSFASSVTSATASSSLSSFHHFIAENNSSNDSSDQGSSSSLAGFQRQYNQSLTEPGSACFIREEIPARASFPGSNPVINHYETAPEPRRGTMPHHVTAATNQYTIARSLTSQREAEDRLAKQKAGASGGTAVRNDFVEDELFKDEEGASDDNQMDDLRRQALQRRQMDEARRDQERISEAQQVLRRKQLQAIMHDTNLTPQQKQVRMQQLMASGMPQTTAPQASHLMDQNKISHSQAEPMYHSPAFERIRLREQSVPQPIPGRTRAQHELLMGVTMIDSSLNSNENSSRNEDSDNQERGCSNYVGDDENEDDSSTRRVFGEGDEENLFQDEEGSPAERDKKRSSDQRCCIAVSILVIVIILVATPWAMVGSNDGDDSASINGTPVPAATVVPSIPASTIVPAVTAAPTIAPSSNTTSPMTTASPTAVATTGLESLFTNQTKSDNVISGANTSMPSLIATWAPTTSVQPSFAPSSIEPTTSAVPTSASIFTPTPPGALIATLESLPEFTREVLNDPTSPQSLAYDFVATHPDLDAMTEQRKLQLFAAATFYYSFQGDSWPEDKRKDYLSPEVSECDWGYLADTNTCVNSDITRWGLYPTDERMPLQGKMPNEIAFLSNLEVLELSFTDHGGEITDLIPSTMGHLVNLRELILSGNLLQGSAPSAEQLLATVDPLQAEQAASDGGLANTLQVLDLGYNLLGGKIPDLSSFVALRELDLQENLFTGKLPTELAKLEDLRHLSLRNTFLTGSLPIELGQLTQLTFLDISATLMRGTIPGRVCALPNLEEIRIDCSAVGCDATCVPCTCN